MTNKRNLWVAGPFEMPQMPKPDAMPGYRVTVFAKFALGQVGGGTDLDLGPGTVFS